MTDKFISKVHFSNQFLVILTNAVTKPTELQEHTAYVINIRLATLTDIGCIGMVHNLSRFVTDGALKNRSKQFQLELKLIHPISRRLSDHGFQSSFHMKYGSLLPFQHLLECKGRSEQTHVRLHVGIKAFLAIGLFVDIQAIGNKNPGVNVKMIHFDAFPSAESHLELNGELIVYFSLNIYHFHPNLDK